ncbi:MAG TPA: hypothetical protein VK507_00320, partial [Iamia sp.]|nr:hypothetical protein [Iamia sp.]
DRVDVIGPLADGFEAMGHTAPGLHDDRTRLVVLAAPEFEPGRMFEKMDANERSAFLPPPTDEDDEHVSPAEGMAILADLFHPGAGKGSALRPSMVLRMDRLPERILADWQDKSLAAGPYLYLFTRDRYDREKGGNVPRYVLLTVDDRRSNDRSLDPLHVPSPRPHVPESPPRRGLAPCPAGALAGDHKLHLRPILAPSYPFRDKPIDRFVQGFMTAYGSRRVLEPVADCERFIGLPDMWHLERDGDSMYFHTCYLDRVVYRTHTVPAFDATRMWDVVESAPTERAQCSNRGCTRKVFRGLTGDDDVVASLASAYRALPETGRMDYWRTVP